MAQKPLTLLLLVVALSATQAGAIRPRAGDIAHSGTPLPAALESFLGDPIHISRELWTGETGGRSVIVAWNGDVLVFKGSDSSGYMRSTDAGLTWTSGNASGDAARYANAVLDEQTGDIIVMNAANHRIARSSNHGVTWEASVPFSPTLDRFGYRPTSFTAHQAGITLQFGPHAGRLLVPTRIQFGREDTGLRGYNYSTAVYSDDRGQTWHTSHPFPVFGTGESALVELADGRVLYNARYPMATGNRYIAISHDGGITWVGPYRDPVLPDGERGNSYGCFGGLVRLPVDGYDILIYSNLDTDVGELPPELGATRTRDREKVTVWASFDGGRTWPVKRRIFDGPSAYSNLGVGRPGTVTEGRIFVSYDGGPAGRNTAAHLVTFNLSWLLDGRSVSDFLN